MCETHATTPPCYWALKVYEPLFSGVATIPIKSGAVVVEETRSGSMQRMYSSNGGSKGWLGSSWLGTASFDPAALTSTQAPSCSINTDFTQRVYSRYQRCKQDPAWLYAWMQWCHTALKVEQRDAFKLFLLQEVTLPTHVRKIIKEQSLVQHNLEDSDADVQGGADQPSSRTATSQVRGRGHTQHPRHLQPPPQQELTLLGDQQGQILMPADKATGIDTEQMWGEIIGRGPGWMSALFPMLFKVC